MKSIKRIAEENEIISAINCFLCKCKFGYKAKADMRGDTKPEILFQEDLKSYLEKKGYTVIKPYSINTSELAVCPAINEKCFEIDLKVTKNDFDCYIEVKYDEVYEDDGERKCTNSDSENQVLRDAYKLQCLKTKFKNAYYLIVFATNNYKHINDFTSMGLGKQTISYNGNKEDFTLKTFETTLIEWQSSQCGIAKEYKYCIIRCN